MDDICFLGLHSSRWIFPLTHLHTLILGNQIYLRFIICFLGLHSSRWIFPLTHLHTLILGNQIYLRFIILKWPLSIFGVTACRRSGTYPWLYSWNPNDSFNSIRLFLYESMTTRIVYKHTSAYSMGFIYILWLYLNLFCCSIMYWQRWPY